jgi:short-subunit dehydrogenase
MKIFLTGASSGIGKASFNLLSQHYQITAPSRSQLNLENFSSIDQLDLSTYDVIVNCAGVNPGTYLGFEKNSWQNQLNQVHVNFVAPLLLAKQYINQRLSGQFVYIGSASVNRPESYNVFNSASKSALRYAISAVKKSNTDIVFSEVCPGKTKTNMLKQNYQGICNDAQIESEYAKTPYLSPEEVANAVLFVIKNKLDFIELCPH